MSFSPTVFPNPRLSSPPPPASDASPTRATFPARGRSPMPLRLAPLRDAGAGNGFPSATLMRTSIAMDQTERQIIDDLFAKLHQAEAQSGPRDPEAEALIRERIVRQPAAPYLMAQAIVMMEQALAASQGRNEELERQLRERPAAQAQSGGGGLFGSLFGGGRPASQPQPQPQYQHPAAAPAAQAAMMPPGSPWGHPAAANGPAGAPAYGDPRVAGYAQQPRAGGGFMAGAMQTAAGVAGGMLIGSALSSMLSGGEAMAGEAAGAATDAATAATDHAEQAVEDSGWGDFGGEEEL